MPSLKPSEGKRDSQRKEFPTLSPNPTLLPAPSTLVSTYVIVCVWAHARPSSSKRRQVTGSSSKGCPHSACLEALLWQEAWVIKVGVGGGSSQTRWGQARRGLGTPAWKTGVADRRTGEAWGRTGTRVRLADLLSAGDTSCFPDKLFLCSVKWAALAAPDPAGSAACSLR